MADFAGDSIWAVISSFVVLSVHLILVIFVTCAKKKQPPTATAQTAVATEPTNIVEPAPETSISTTTLDQAQTPFVPPPASESTQPQEASDSYTSNRPVRIVDSVKTTRSRLQRTKSPPRHKSISSSARPTFTRNLDVDRCLPEDSALLDKPSRERLTAESVTEEIRVPIGKTAKSPVPQSSLTHKKNLKDIGKPRPEPASVKFGEERISTTRSQPAARD